MQLCAGCCCLLKLFQQAWVGLPSFVVHHLVGSSCESKPVSELRLLVPSLGYPGLVLTLDLHCQGRSSLLDSKFSKLKPYGPSCVPKLLPQMLSQSQC